MVIFRNIITTERSAILRMLHRLFLTIGSLIFLLILIILLVNPLSIKEPLVFYKEKIYLYIGISDFTINDIGDLGNYISGIFSSYISGSPVDSRIDIKIKQKGIINLHNQLENPSDRVWVKGRFSVNDEAENREFRAKFRSKGDRKIHFHSLNNMSYRVNIRGKDRLYGIEEFSLQKPIIRNYTWEYLFSSIAEKENILTLKMLPVQLSLNGDSKGVYSLEEVPSKNTIERQKRKNGPIWKIDEEFGTNFPNVKFSVFDKKHWLSNKDFVYSSSIINNLKYDTSMINRSFDLDLWAKYFALIDVFGGYHGSEPKSVKLYFNPTTGKFEPLVYDVHIGAGKFDNFTLLDFYTTSIDALDCRYLCENHSWFKLFFNSNNKNFINLYLKYLDRYSSDEFRGSIKDIYKDKFQKIDNYFYSKFLPVDRVFYAGFMPYYLDLEYLDKRAALIKSRLNTFSVLEPNVTLINPNNFLDEILTNVKVSYFHNLEIENGSLSFERDQILLLTGHTKLGKSPNGLTVSGPVMIIQMDGNLDIGNLKMIRSKSHNIQGRNWSGAINVIKAKLDVSELTIYENDSEDALNVVSSTFEIKNLFISNSRSDAFDSDFSNGTISNLICKNIGNDCLDTSESTISVNQLEASYVQDKGISAGENSRLNVSKALITNSEIGVVSKDGSQLQIDNLFSSNNKLSGAVYRKKNTYADSFLKISNLSNNDDGKGFLAYRASSINLPINYNYELFSSDEIKSMFYGKGYGSATLK